MRAMWILSNSNFLQWKKTLKAVRF